MDCSVIYLTVKELAEEAGVSQKLVRKHVQEGLLSSSLGEETGLSFKQRGEGGTRVRRKKCGQLLFAPEEVKAYKELMKNFVPDDGRKTPKERPFIPRKGVGPGLSCTVAARYCGVSDVTIRAAVKAGFIEALRENPIRINEKELDKYNKAKKDRINLKEGALLLKVTASALNTMVEQGKVQQVFPHMGCVYVSRKQIKEMAEKYEETHREVPDGVYPTLRRIKEK